MGSSLMVIDSLQRSGKSLRRPKIQASLWLWKADIIMENLSCCDWVDIRPSRGLKKDKYRFPLVNFSRPLVHTGEKLSDDPFIISSQAKQVFHIDDIRDVGWSHVIQTKPRDIYDMGSDENKDEFESYTQCMPCTIPILDDVNEAPSWHRTNIEIDSDDE
ncbi:RNA-directed DNA polymerase [Tanacetum coccineum]|uniref:RNA-directed DNA polymerase n=1 Tax=Tanacetum coccineum TaxID=301880 RepID=A0ABQ5BVW5_9ASTR